MVITMKKRKINSHEYSEYEDRYQPLTLFSFMFFIVSFLLPTRKMEKIRCVLSKYETSRHLNEQEWNEFPKDFK